MKVAISQPTYLPWMGYFDLIDQVDSFVFLDGVQFEKRSWQQRNRIKGSNGLILLTVPVSVKGQFGQLIAQVTISDIQDWRKHSRSVEMNYRRARFFEKYWLDFNAVLEAGWKTGSLVDLNLAMIRWCMRQLGIEKPMLQSSQMPCTGKRSELLAEICKRLGATCYLSPLGSAEYLLEEAQEFTTRGIEVQFQHYEHPSYEQQYPPFVPYASVIDLIFNLGDEAISVVRSGRRTPFSIGEVRHSEAERREARA
jgi:WbqC-like protein family